MFAVAVCVCPSVTELLDILTYSKVVEFVRFAPTTLTKLAPVEKLKVTLYVSVTLCPAVLVVEYIRVKGTV